MFKLQVFWIFVQESYVSSSKQVNQCQRVHQEDEETNWASTWWDAYSSDHLQIQCQSLSSFLF